MASPSPPPPTPDRGPLVAVFQFLFEHWLGQALVAAAAAAVLGFVFRVWIKAALRRVWASIADLRIRRKSTVAAEIKAAVAAAESAMQAKHDAQAAQARKVRQSADPWSQPRREKSEEEVAAEREERRRKGEREDRWVISTDRSRHRGYVLRNVAAGRANDVRLSPKMPRSFEVITGPPWLEIDEGTSVPFEGRIARPDDFAIFSRELLVEWTDDHGDEQFRHVSVDRVY